MLRANIRTDGRKPLKGIGHRVYKINFQFEKVEGIFVVSRQSSVDVWRFSSPSKLPDFVWDWFEGLIAHFDQTPPPAKVNVETRLKLYIGLAGPLIYAILIRRAIFSVWSVKAQSVVSPEFEWNYRMLSGVDGGPYAYPEVCGLNITQTGGRTGSWSYRMEQAK
jgi:hypothetical protein